MTIKHKAKRPKDLPDDVHVFTDEATKRDWHAQVEYRPVTTEGVTHMVLVVHIKEEDGTVHAGPHSFAINEAELADPSFSPETFVEDKIVHHIQTSERIRSNKEGIAGAMTKFKPKST